MINFSKLSQNRPGKTHFIKTKKKRFIKTTNSENDPFY